MFCSIITGDEREVHTIVLKVHALHVAILVYKQMLSRYGKDSSVTAMIDKLDWVILPVFNVDGYEYTHTSVS